MANDFESTLAELSRETAQSLHDAAEKLRRSRYKTYRATKTFPAWNRRRVEGGGCGPIRSRCQRG